MAKLISMKRDAKDKREDRMECAPMEAVQPDFPWGLVLHLDKDELEKLGMKTMPAVGTKTTIQAKVTVTRVSQSAADGAKGSEEQRSVDLQITDLAIGEGKG